MTKYLLLVDFQSGPDETPMDEWTPEEIQAHLDYYVALNDRLAANGELVDHTILTGPDHALVVRSDGATAPVVTDGPFQEYKEWVAGFQVVDVDTVERAVEIAALVSAVPGRGGVPTGQPVTVRRVMDDGPVDAAAMESYVRTGDVAG